MSDSLENIKIIMDHVLGESKREYAGSGGWYEYNCPHCTDENCGTPDGKYNLAVQITEDSMYGHCWKCGYHGKIYSIIKEFGSNDDVSEYKDEINRIKEGRLFELGQGIIDDCCDLLCDNTLELPNGYIKMSDKYKSSWAKRYLDGRGVNDKIINKFNIGFVGFEKGNRFSNRIVIPSYDSYGDMNYWIARDYTDKSKNKILNPDVDKNKIVFNEKYINWYEPVTIVEGPFDHIVTPNSIPLLGKSIDYDYAIFNALRNKCHSTINILLDDDAISDAKRMYKFLNTEFIGRVRLIECPEGYDASDYYRDFGYKGIIQLLRSAHKLTDFELNMID